MVLARFMETGLGSVAGVQCLSTPLLPPVKTEPAFPGSPAVKTALPSLPCSWGQQPSGPGELSRTGVGDGREVSQGAILSSGAGPGST